MASTECVSDCSAAGVRHQALYLSAWVAVTRRALMPDTSY